jgi:hypothetical protein
VVVVWAGGEGDELQDVAMKESPALLHSQESSTFEHHLHIPMLLTKMKTMKMMMIDVVDYDDDYYGDYYDDDDDDDSMMCLHHHHINP